MITYELKEEAAFIIDLSSRRHYIINKKVDMIVKKWVCTSNRFSIIYYISVTRYYTQNKH